MIGISRAGVLLLAVNLRPTAVSVGPVLEEVRDGLHMGASGASLLTSLPVLAFVACGIAGCAAPPRDGAGGPVRALAGPRRTPPILATGSGS